MPERSYWFTKWLIAFGLFLPFWGYISMSGYTPEQSFLWNAANHPVNVGFLPKENAFNCWSYDIRSVVNEAFGFGRETQPRGCLVKAQWSYMTVLSVSFFCLITGIYFFFYTPPEVAPRIEVKEGPRKARKVSLTQELETMQPEEPVSIARPRRAIAPDEGEEELPPAPRTAADDDENENR